MAGYQTIDSVRPVLHRGPPPTPVLDRMLFYKPRQYSQPTLEQVKRLIELRSTGMSFRVISQKTGIKPSTVRRHTLHVRPPLGGWSDGRRKSRFTEKQIQKAERMLRAGFFEREVAEELGCHRITLRRLLGRAKNYRRPQAPLSRVIRAVSRATGIAGRDIYQTDPNGGKVTYALAKARRIVFWIAHTHLGMTEAEIAKRLGGFHICTISRGCRLTAPVAEKLKIQPSMPPGVVAGLLWRAEWPKASA